MEVHVVQKEEKVIGFKVPADSDLPNRLKGIVQRTRLKYGELLEKWIAQEEKELETSQLQLFPNGDEQVNQQLTEQSEKLTSEYKARIEALEEKVSELLTTWAKPKLAKISRTETDSFPVEAVARISELSKEGLSARKIAQQLEAEGIKTQKGKTQWHHDSVRNIQKRLQLQQVNQEAQS